MIESTLAKPVIFLAFANDRVDDVAYLRNLPKELSGIRTVLQKAIKADLCEVVERVNATIDQILDVFQDEYYKDRIAIFHYGGHANGYQLLLETLEGQHAAAHSEGLVSFLTKQKGLKLVFLNGCSSAQQALDLVKTGISAVIGTSQSINDDVATSLALRFYAALGNGANLERAWLEAIDQVKIQKGTANMRDLFFDGMEEELDDISEIAQNQPDRFPWDIYFREGAELVKSWNLPDATANPLFGLPEPLSQDLPEKPYRFLERYTRDHCDIFFGRSYYIRDLYLRAIDPKAAPVVLFYGQSGVGKSSVLDAGVFPRLEQSCQVVYIRRDQQIGLLGTLRRALGMSHHHRLQATPHSTEQQQITSQIKQLKQLLRTSPESIKPSLSEALEQLEALATPNESTEQEEVEEVDNLLETWLASEQKNEKPLIILLDQVEEAFTRPNHEIHHELEGFVREVKTIFQSSFSRPQGKLILSYRKEYHPEINEACKNYAIPREEIFLKALDRKDIVEVIIGLTKTKKLQRRYQLNVDEELPVIIADDLLEDKDSPIAPVLQILLTKMWNQTADQRLRHFSVDHYQSLRKQGILMDDFFTEQMAALALHYPDDVASGLALDILEYHTTKTGTADAKNLEELRERYNDRQAIMDQLIEHFKRLHLLSSIDAARTGLAHDTLAPLVLDKFRHSSKPGQRAAIILENKIVAYEQEPNTVIDVDDLRIVEEGAAGMRLWTTKEEELIEKSRIKRKKIVAFRRRVRRLGILAFILIVIGAGVATWQYRETAEALADLAQTMGEKKEAEASEKEALVQKKMANKQTEMARIAEDKAKEAEKEAQKQKQIAEHEKQIAESEKRKADKLRQEALEQRKLAQIAEQNAKMQTERANRERVSADSKIKAMNMEMDKLIQKADSLTKMYEHVKRELDSLKGKP